jgi:Phage portal protein
MGFFDDLTKGIRQSLSGDIEEMLKGDGNAVADKPQDLPQNDGAIGQKAIITDPFFDQVHQHFIFRSKMSRISNKTLKDTSVRDWTVSAIIQARCDTMLRFARPQRKNLDMGYKIQKKNQHHDVTKDEREEIANLEDYIYHCGRKDNVPPGEEMLFGEFLKLCTRDALTFGHVAVEKVLTRRQSLHRFRPLPAESVYIINPKTNKDIVAKEIEMARLTYKAKTAAYGGNNPEASQVFNEPDIEYFKYVQMSYDNRVLSAFGDEDMVFKLFNPQNFADSMGYCYSPLELAIINITNHLNVENYNANFFTHGYAARGVLHLKGTVTQSQLTAFRRQFYNTISGAQHAWRTPIIAGLDEVQWVPLSGSAKEMEYLNYNNHLLRALCTQFQIDPVELGLDYLVTGSGRAAMQQASNEYKINYSRERGLIPILMMFEDMINSSVLPAIDKEMATKYEFKFTGYDDDSPQTHIAQQQAEMTVYSTMNDLLRAAGKETMKHEVADLPLNQTFWMLAEKHMTKGEIRETFFGDKSAKGRRELAYFPADTLFMGWQQLLLTMDRSKQQDKQAAQQVKAEQEAQQKQQGLDEASHGREQEAHDATMDQVKARQAHAAVAHESLKDSAKQFGAGSKGLAAPDGQGEVANPINSDLADET